jgi:transcriptional regulator with XRE-family HTH domain
LSNLKQVELADAANISRGHLSRIESPNTTDKSFSIATVFDIAEALGVEPALLFAYKDLSKHEQ